MQHLRTFRMAVAILVFGVVGQSMSGDGVVRSYSRASIRPALQAAIDDDPHAFLAAGR